MHEEDAVEAHDRLRTLRPRAAAEPLAAAPAAPRVPELSALLSELDTLRLTLSADLGLAASAVEVGALDVARDVVAGGQHDVMGFSSRAQELLASRRPVVHEPEPEPSRDAPEPVPAGSRRHARRLALLAPALTAAAALVGLLAGVVSSPGAHGAGGASLHGAANASYAELWRLHDGGAPTTGLAEAARDLHAEVARLVALGADDAAGAQQAQRLLELELALLDDPRHGGHLGAEQAEVQRLLAQLREALGRTPADEVLAQAPLPARPVPTEVTPLVVVPLPEAPVAAPELPRVRPAEPSPGAAAPAADPRPVPEPSAAGQQDAAPQPTPQAQPAPSPSSTGDLLPQRSTGTTGSKALLDPSGD